MFVRLPLRGTYLKTWLRVLTRGCEQFSDLPSVCMVTLENITVGQFQELYKVQKSSQDDLDKMTESVSILSGKTVREVEEMLLPEFNNLSQQITKIWEAYRNVPERKPSRIIKGYGILYEPGKLTTGQYVTAMHFMKGDVIENMHFLMASITYNIKTGKHEAEKHPKIASDLQDALFMDVHAACVFFCHLFTRSIQGLESFFLKEMIRSGMKPLKARQYLRTLLMNLDGFTTLSGLPNLKE